MEREHLDAVTGPLLEAFKQKSAPPDVHTDRPTHSYTVSPLGYSRSAIWRTVLPTPGPLVCGCRARRAAHPATATTQSPRERLAVPLLLADSFGCTVKYRGWSEHIPMRSRCLPCTLYTLSLTHFRVHMPGKSPETKPGSPFFLDLEPRVQLPHAKWSAPNCTVRARLVTVQVMGLLHCGHVATAVSSPTPAASRALRPPVPSLASTSRSLASSFGRSSEPTARSSICACSSFLFLASVPPPFRPG